MTPAEFMGRVAGLGAIDQSSPGSCSQLNLPYAININAKAGGRLNAEYSSRSPSQSES
jgi:hypothetical protein